MTSRATDKRRDEVLRDWCEAATVKAAEVSGRSDLGWKQSGERIYRYHCPNPDGGHEWKGDDQSAWVTIGADGRIRAGCRVCAPKGAEAEDAYTETVKALLGWQDEDGFALRPGKEYRLIREHLWRTWDDSHEVKTIKVRVKGDRTDKWWWRLREVDPGRRGFLAPSWRSFPKPPSEWAAERWPVFKGINLALKLYHDEAFDGLDVYSVILCEGAKDADTVRDLMAAVPNAGMVATATQSPKLDALAPHHEVRIRGRRVVILGDADKGGEEFRRNASGLVWSAADSVKLFPAGEVFADGQDVSDWVEERRAKGATTRELADEFLRALASTPVLDAPLAEPRGWIGKLKRGEKGVSKTSVANAKVVWTEHPDLQGRVSTNARSGEIEVVHPPWGDVERSVGFRRVARSCAAWLEEQHDVALSIPTLEDALHIDGVAPMHNPLATLIIGDDWDGVPRLDALFSHYLPLQTDPGVAVRLSRIFMGDLVAKLAGDLGAQRLLVAIHTDEPLDVAGALLGRHGVQHRGRVEVRQVAQFAMQEAGLVQVSTEPIVDRSMARGSIACMFASHLAQPHGLISSPMFVAVGSAGPSIERAAESSVDERCLILEPDGEMKVAALRDDADQLLAEAAARRDELLRTEVVRRSEVRTVDDQEVDENLAFVLGLLREASLRQIDHPEQAMANRFNPAALRSQPREFISRSWFLEVFAPMLSARWRDQGTQAKMFNRACRRMGFLHNNSVIMQLTRAQADNGGIRWPEERENPQITIPGVKLTEGRRAAIYDLLYLRPTKDHSKDQANPLNLNDKSNKTNGPFVRGGIFQKKIGDSFPARAPAYESIKGEGLEKTGAEKTADEKTNSEDVPPWE